MTWLSKMWLFNVGLFEMMMMMMVSISITITEAVTGSGVIRMNLGGDNWYVTNGSMKDIGANVPGDIYTDLIAAKILDDPYYGWNPMLYQWVAYSNWTYSTTFRLSDDLSNKKVIQMIAEGIDTNASIYLNGQLLFQNDNMFQRNRLDISGEVRKYGAPNTLEIKFQSKVWWAMSEANSCRANTSDEQCPTQCPPDVYEGFCNVNFIRTEPCSFSWDWGPGFSPIGIFRDIYLQGYDFAVTRDVLLYSTPNKKNYTQWHVEFNVFIDAGITDALLMGDTQKTKKQTIEKKELWEQTKISGTIVVNMTDFNHATMLPISLMSGTEANFTVNLGTIKNLEPWYPNGFGEQRLYNIHVYFQPSASDAQADEGITIQVGFRDVELIQNPLPGGTSFYFQINGMPIPIHGSNWIPADAFESRVNETVLTPLFVALKDSHQNMIRNWGGGIYQRDIFYNMADRYGIMIWEDMMWACANYWVRPEFLQSSAKEVLDNVRRIQYHPSIVLWAGNNENYCTANTSGEEPYRELYFVTILNNITSLDHTRPAVVSSPSNGDETINNPCSNDPNNPFYGDAHSYLYNIDCWNVSLYLRPRFMSEFGLQSWPSFITLQKYFPKDQWNWNSELVANRQHHPDGQSQIEASIGMHYNMPNSGNNETDFQGMLFLSQVYQGYCYKVEVEFLRSIRFECTEQESGCNMGQMYWQTNDIWPGASWSGIDWTARYKILQYYAQHFYDPISVVGYLNGTQWTFKAINDHLYDSIDQGQVDFIAYSWSQSNQVGMWTVRFSIGAADARVISLVDYDQLLEQSGCSSWQDCVLTWKVYNSGQMINENWMFVSSPKDISAKNPQLKITNVSQDQSYANSFTITFTSQATAAFVWLETPINGYFSDNALLMPTGQKTVQFHSRENVTLAQVQQSLNIYSLYEMGGFQTQPWQ